MKYALVTGGSGGIGGAISIKIAEIGYHVLVHYNRRKDAADQIVNTIKQSNGLQKVFNLM